MSEQRTDSLKDLNIVITGAGRGLGAALALSLSEFGSNVILCGRSPEALDAIAGHIETRTGRRSKTVILDLADADSVEKAAKAITSNFPAVDVLINNGMMWLENRADPYDAAEVLGVVNSAITGTFLLTQALLPVFQKSERPDVVTIGSITSLPNFGLHAASVPFYAAKHGQAGLADGLRQMLWGTPVRSICIHPPWLRDISPLDDEWEAVPSLSKGALATNRDVVEAVCFAITQPRHITIASMVIDSDSRGIDYRGHLEA
ncbi:MAG: SDR family NAD(P)-dependent oxidoreductase [Chloroflexi bacterium]|nr:SDR family NAD(P)-dependent oxidoreductase [Chloroflexota bacterium]